MFRFQKSVAGMMALLFVLIMLAGCASGTNKGESANASGQEGSSTEASANTRVIKHAMGETTITGTPKRIVTLYQGANDIVVSLGIKPVGIVESWEQQPVYDYLKADLGDVQQVGQETQPNLEEIHKLKPDLIIATKTRHEDIYEQLSQIAPTIVTDKLYDWKEGVKLIGEASDHQEQANQLLADWDKRTADFKQKMGDRLPIVANIINFREDEVRVYYLSYAGMILKDLGFTRPAGQNDEDWGAELTTKESIPDLNADMIFNFNYDKGSPETVKLYNDWTSSPLWANLDAVKKHQVYQVDEILWNMAGGYKSANLLLDDLYKQLKLN